MRLVCISDTHTFHEDVNLPDGDILIHAGDFTNKGGKSDVEDFFGWLMRIKPKYRYILFIAGNHDKCFDEKYGEITDWLAEAIAELEKNDIIITTTRKILIVVFDRRYSRIHPNVHTVIMEDKRYFNGVFHTLKPLTILSSVAEMKSPARKATMSSQPTQYSRGFLRCNSEKKKFIKAFFIVRIVKENPFSIIDQ